MAQTDGTPSLFSLSRLSRCSFLHHLFDVLIAALRSRSKREIVSL